MYPATSDNVSPSAKDYFEVIQWLPLPNIEQFHRIIIENFVYFAPNS